jgi:hypothetical protein
LDEISIRTFGKRRRELNCLRGEVINVSSELGYQVFAQFTDSEFDSILEMLQEKVSSAPPSKFDYLSDEELAEMIEAAEARERAK